MIIFASNVPQCVPSTDVQKVGVLRESRGLFIVLVQ